MSGDQLEVGRNLIKIRQQGESSRVRYPSSSHNREVMMMYLLFNVEYDYQTNPCLGIQSSEKRVEKLCEIVEHDTSVE